MAFFLEKSETGNCLLAIASRVGACVTASRYIPTTNAAATTASGQRKYTNIHLSFYIIYIRSIQDQTDFGHSCMNIHIFYMCCTCYIHTVDNIRWLWDKVSSSCSGGHEIESRLGSLSVGAVTSLVRHMELRVGYVNP